MCGRYPASKFHSHLTYANIADIKAITMIKRFSTHCGMIPEHRSAMERRQILPAFKMNLVQHEGQTGSLVF